MKQNCCNNNNAGHYFLVRMRIAEALFWVDSILARVASLDLPQSPFVLVTMPPKVPKLNGRVDYFIIKPLESSKQEGKQIQEGSAKVLG